MSENKRIYKPQSDFKGWREEHQDRVSESQSKSDSVYVKGGKNGSKK